LTIEPEDCLLRLLQGVIGVTADGDVPNPPDNPYARSDIPAATKTRKAIVPARWFVDDGCAWPPPPPPIAAYGVSLVIFDTATTCGVEDEGLPPRTVPETCTDSPTSG
jgi:hypothetical protein